MSSVGTLRAATTLALWTAAAQGGASADDVLGAIDDAGHRAGVRAATAEISDATGLPGPGWPSAGSAALLPLLRDGGAAGKRHCAGAQRRSVAGVSVHDKQSGARPG